MIFARRHRHQAHHERVLGTSLELQFLCDKREAGARAEEAVLAEVDRLTAIFNAYDGTSELSRWQMAPARTPLPVSPELARVLELAEQWRLQTHGAFNPATEALTRLWRDAASQGHRPDAAALAREVNLLAGPLWQIQTNGPVATRLTEAPVTLNSIAKGFVVDQALKIAAGTPGVRRAVINAGGDLACGGDAAFRVAIGDPFSDAENAEPTAVVQVQNMAVATSGNYRRGFRVGDQWHSHVLDPRSGQPVDALCSASVLAPSCLQADVLATAYSVMGPQQAMKHATAQGHVGLLLIESNGNRTVNSFWREHSLAVSA